MKNLFLLISLISFDVFAQEYKPMANHNSEWHLESCNTSCRNDIYYTDGDTTFNGTNYTVLNGYHFIMKTFWLRENEAEKKVYLSVQSGNKREEFLLYDFSLIIGDSMNMKNPGSPFPLDAGYFTLDSIVERTIYNGDDHRFFYFSPSTSNSSNENPVWIEGIGSLGLINAPGTTPKLYGVGKLSCHFDEGELIYTQLDSLDACVPNYLFVNLEEAQLNQFIQIHPTFVNDILTIDSEIALERVFIFNVSGKLVKEVTLKHSLKEEVNMDDLNDGIYFIRIHTMDSRVVSKRIVKA